MSSTDFRLQFEPSEIPALAKRYSYNQNDDDALEAGHQIAHGDYSRKNLESIFRWKTKGRGISRLGHNSDEDIADALHLAVIAQTERSAVAVLIGLNGVDVPVASAILTVIDPERYTIIDFRALESLGANVSGKTIGFYLDCLAFCQGLARQNNVSLRHLDQALWQWSNERKRQSAVARTGA